MPYRRDGDRTRRYPTGVEYLTPVRSVYPQCAGRPLRTGNIENLVRESKKTK